MVPSHSLIACRCLVCLLQAGMQRRHRLSPDAHSIRLLKCVCKFLKERFCYLMNFPECLDVLNATDIGYKCNASQKPYLIGFIHVITISKAGNCPINSKQLKSAQQTWQSNACKKNIMYKQYFPSLLPTSPVPPVVGPLHSCFPLLKCAWSQIEPLQLDSMLCYAKRPHCESWCVGAPAHLYC